MADGRRRWRSVLALVLLVPAPSLGLLAAMVLFPDSTLGKGLFAASKVWLLAFPVVWLKVVDRGRIGLSPVRNGGLLMGLASGAGLGLLIVLAYLGLGHGMIDKPAFVGKLREIGLGSLPVYLGGAAYWILVNSVLEEYVWRWFVYRTCETLVRPVTAVLLSALFFTLHHIIALWIYFGPPLAILCSLGVFVSGVVWSAMYWRYRSVWPGYVSHAIADLTIFGLGAVMLCGG